MIEIKDADAYQKMASRTLIAEPDTTYTAEELQAVWDTLMLSGLVGTVAEEVKKGVFHRHGLNQDQLSDALASVEMAACGDMISVGPEGPAEGPALMLTWNALGLAGEAGEVARLIDDHVVEGQPLDREKLKKELGDCLWYIAALATKEGLSLSEIMLHNITKLMQRYPEGYSSEASRQRVDTKEG